MLGLGSSCNKEEGYAKGERYRERFHVGGSDDGSADNPLGRTGLESYYIGDFADSGDKDVYSAEAAASVSISSGAIQYRTTANPGYIYTKISVVPNTSYIIKATWDPNDAATGEGNVKIGTTHGAHDIGQGTATTTEDTDFAVTFNSRDNKDLFVTLHTGGAGKWGAWDDISLKEA